MNNNSNNDKNKVYLRVKFLSAMKDEVSFQPVMNTTKIIALVIAAIGCAIIVAGSPIMGVVIVAAAGYVGLSPVSQRTTGQQSSRNRW